MRLKVSVCMAFLLLLLAGTSSAFAMSIEGQVRDAHWGPNYERYLKNVKVYPKNNPANSTMTGADGQYKLQDVDDTDEFIVFEKSGYVTDMKKINGEKLDMALVETGLTTISDERFFNEYLNLDFEGMEKVKSAWQKNDILLAKYEMIEYYRNRKSPVWNITPKKPSEIVPDPSYSTLQVDQELAHNFTNGGVTANADTSPGSGDLNWKTIPAGDREWLWGINRAFSILHMGNAWEKTLDPKYAYEYMSEYIDWIADNPKPFFKDTTNTWRTIEVGIRNHYPLPNSWFTLLFNEEVTTETRMTILKSNLEHMEYLTSYMGSANWLIFESRGLYTLATLHPQFKKSPMWKEIGIGRGFAQYLGQFKEDGWQFEITPNYHMESTNSISELEKIANLNGEKTPIREGLKKANDVELYFTLPGGRSIPSNDTGLTDFRGVMRNAASLLGDIEGNVGQEYIFGGTDFRAGRKPQNSTMFFNYSGYLVMRDFWGPNNITAFFEGGPSGVGHGWGSRDKLQFVMSAYGRDMLLESGVYSYTSEPIAKYMYTTRAHNTLTVDGEDQVRRKRGMDEPAKNVEYHAGAGFDYITSLYDENFGEIKQIEVKHNRKVLFDKSGFFIINDRLTGDGEHSASQYWNMASCKWEHEKSTNKITGKFDDGTGFILIPVSDTPLKFDAVQGGEDPLRGWNASSPNQALPIPSIRFFTDNVKLPLSVDTLIMPFEGETPKVKVERLKTNATQASGLKITFGDGRIVYYLVRHIGEGVVTYDNFQFDGEAAMITQNADKTINIKKYPENSMLNKDGSILSDITIEVKTPNSADILNTKTVTLSADVKGIEQGETEFFATYQSSGNKVTASVAKCGIGDAALWDISEIENQTGVILWATVKDGAGNIIASNKQKEIEILKEVDAAAQLELEDRAFPKTNGTVTMMDAGASLNVAVVLPKDDNITGTVNLPVQAKLKLRARATKEQNAQLTVVVNDTKQEIALTSQYQWIEIGDYTDRIHFEFSNTGENHISLDCVKLIGDGIGNPNNKVLHHRVDLPDNNTYFGDSDWKNYVVSAKLKFQHIYGSPAEGGGGITARYNSDSGYGLYYDSKENQLQIRQKTPKGWSVINKTEFKWNKTGWYNFKLKVDEGKLCAKVWNTAEQEPEEWILTTEIKANEIGAAALNCSHSDMLIDDIKISSVDETKTMYFTDMENVMNGSRPVGWTVTKSDSWFCDDVKIIKY